MMSFGTGQRRRKAAKFLWQREGAPEPVLSQEQIQKIMEFAKQASKEDYFLFALMGIRGLRVGAVTGLSRVQNYVLKDGSRRTITVDLPGLRKEDVLNDSIIVHLKGGGIRKMRVPQLLLEELQSYAKGLVPGQKLVEFGERTALERCKDYATRIGIENPHHYYPHLFRHAFGSYWARKTGRDPWKVRDLMGHKSVASTSRYVSNLTLEEEKELLG